MRALLTDQTTTLCVQEVEIYLERWEVLGALVDVCRARNTDQHKHRHVTTPKGAKRLLKMACNKVCMTARGKMVRLSVNG